MASHKEMIEKARKTAHEMMNAWKGLQKARDEAEKKRWTEVYSKHFMSYRGLIESCFKSLYKEEKEYMKHSAEISRFIRDIEAIDRIKEGYWNRLWSEFDNLNRKAA